MYICISERETCTFLSLHKIYISSRDKDYASVLYLGTSYMCIYQSMCDLILTSRDDSSFVFSWNPNCIQDLFKPFILLISLFDNIYLKIFYARPNSLKMSLLFHLEDLDESFNTYFI